MTSANLIENIQNELWDERLILDEFILDKDDVEDCIQADTPFDVFVNLRRLFYAKKKEMIIDLVLAVKAEYDNHIAALTAIPEVVTDEDSFYFHAQVEKLLEQMKNTA